jgi:3-polyprenyl-4-hydroxybenzoate decarboxylase
VGDWDALPSTIISNVAGSDLDPSDLKDGVTAKMGIDATAKPRLDSFTPKHRVPKDILDRLDLKDYVPASWLAQKDGRR